MILDTLEGLPEHLHSQFEEVEVDGKKVFQDKDALELKKLSFNVKEENKGLKKTSVDVKEENKELRAKIDDFETRLKDFEKAKVDEIEAARSKGLEDARTSGDVMAVEERYKQQVEDLKKRTQAQLDEWEKKFESLQGTVRAEKRGALIADLVSEMANDKGIKAMKILLSNRIDIDPETGVATFLDASGGATALDLDGFKEEIKRDDLFSPLLKSGVTTTGGGNANGSGDSGADSGRKFSDYSGSELVAIKRQDPTRYERLKKEHYST